MSYKVPEITYIFSCCNSFPVEYPSTPQVAVAGALKDPQLYQFVKEGIPEVH